jgi:hypothetical protein
MKACGCPLDLTTLYDRGRIRISNMRGNVWAQALVVLYFLNGFSALADDGFVVSDGDTLHPVNTTTISMSREDLSIAYDDMLDSWRVQVHFVFHNPTDKVISHLVAFESFSLTGTGYDEAIRDFATTVDGIPVEITHTIQQISDGSEGTMFPVVKEMFSFNVEFPPGDILIDHSYRYFGSIGWGPERRGLPYTLKTAKRWAGPIGEFHLRIALPPNSILLPEIDWSWLQPYGDFSLKPKFMLLGEYPSKNGIFIREGGFKLDAKDFVPSTDLWLDIYDFSWYLQTEVIIPGKKITTSDLLFRELSQVDLIGYTPSELRLIRNAIFAWHGYGFQDSVLRQYFEKFIWYGGVTWDPSAMTPTQTRNVKLFQSME